MASLGGSSEVSCQPELQSPEGLTGAAGSASQVAHAHAWQGGDGWWPEASVHYHMTLSV